MRGKASAGLVCLCIAAGLYPHPAFAGGAEQAAIIVGTEKGARENKAEEENSVTKVTITDADMNQTGSSAIAAALERSYEGDLAKITRLKVETDGTATLSPSDNAFLKENLTSLEFLDESDCSCSRKRLSEPYLTKSGLPDVEYAEFGGLSGFASLKKVVISREAQVLSGLMNMGIVELTIPENVLLIENSAFANCRAFVGNLVLPDSLVYIGNNAFGAGDSPLECGELILGKSVKYIDNNAFKSRVFKGNLIIPDACETIGNWVFASGSFSNGTWTLGSRLRYVGDAAMSKICSGNSGKAVIPNSLVLGDTAFGYSTFEEIEFESGTTKIGVRAFRDSANLKKLTIPGTVTSMGNGAFSGCTNLSSVNLAEGVDTIGKSCFSGCTALNRIALPSTLKTISDNSFDKSGLVGIFLDDGIETIGSRAFMDLPEGSCLYLQSDKLTEQINQEQGYAGWNRRYDKSKTYIAYTNGGACGDSSQFEKGSLATPQKDGYTFVGWYETDDFSGESVDSASAGKTYYAKWASEIVFNVNGGEGEVDSKLVDEGKAYGDLPVPSRLGYTFKGWYSEPGGGEVVSSADIPTGNETLYAQWKANEYTISFDAKGGDGTMENIRLTYDSPAALPTNKFTKTNMIFEGWDTDLSADEIKYSDATQVENLTGENGGTVTLYAVWGVKAALVPSLEAQKVTYNGSIQKFSLPDGFKVSYERDGKKVEPKNAGSYDVVIHADETEKYAEYNATVYGGLIIERAPLVIKADDKSMYVSGKLPEFTCSVDGLKGSDTLDSIGLKAGVSCSADGKTTGSFDIVVAVEGDPANYSVKKENGTLTVSNRPVTPPSSDKTEVEHNQDGSTTTTVTKPDGSQTITHETATGTESVVKKDKDGNVTSTEVSVSKQDAASGKVELPIEPFELAADASKAPEVEVKVPAVVTAEKPVQVTVPVAKEQGAEPNYGIVVFAVDAEGNETVIPKCAVDEDGNVVFEATGDVTIKVVDAAKDMPDVTDADWFAGGVVDFATARGIVNGVDTPSGKQFQGYGKTSRGMLVAMLHNLELNPEAAGDATLPDVPADAFYADAAAWALGEGILSGVDMPDGSKQFQGNADVTREQVAVFLMRYAQYLGMDVSARAEVGFPDASEVSAFAKDAMSWAVAEGLFKGDDATGELNPTDGAARAEVAAVLMRFINLMYV